VSWTRKKAAVWSDGRPCALRALSSPQLRCGWRAIKLYLSLYELRRGDGAPLVLGSREFGRARLDLQAFEDELRRRGVQPERAADGASL